MIGGVKKFIIHSRKCFLKGLTTKQNRDIPPLKYDTVHRLVREFPDLTFVLNGGITSLSQAQSHMSTWKRSDINLDNMGIYSTFDPNILNHEEFDSVSYPAVHGVMIGRAAYNNPLLLANADSQIFHVKDPHVSRRDLLERYISYCEFCQSENGPTKKTFRGTEDVISTSILLKPVHAIMNGCHNSPKYKQLLNDLYVERVKKGIVNPSCREVVRFSEIFRIV
jgi:tRNA-dihydrouridine synthase A